MIEDKDKQPAEDSKESIVESSTEKNVQVSGEGNLGEERNQEVVHTESQADVADVVSANEVKTPTDEADAEGGEGHDDHEDDEDAKLLDELHLDNPTKQEVYNTLKKFSAVEKMRVLDQALKELKPVYDSIRDAEEAQALKAFEADGNDPEGFEYKGDDTDAAFQELYSSLRRKKQQYFSDLERTRESNLTKKNNLLERIRELVDGEESTDSINAVKELQEEWKNIGQVPVAHVKTLWANYNALLDRYYDNRSIYFELKELDRKKNLEAKLELCERAEALQKEESIKSAVQQLNDLHEEYKHIGPVPKEDQESTWQRFKAASDLVYARRREHIDAMKVELGKNAEDKQALGDEAAGFASFDSDRITEWNEKTKELLELQKKWDIIGGLPRDKAKHINKHFWNNFKQFFNNKNAFFKTLENQREDNLKRKQELLAKAQELSASEEWDKTASQLKELQAAWREIGPVPEKFKNSVYKDFRKACDAFFNKRRSRNEQQNEEFEENLKQKKKICEDLVQLSKDDECDLDKVYDLVDSYAELGFVPRNAIKSIQKQYDDATGAILSSKGLSSSDRNDLKNHIGLSKLKNGPNSGDKINRKEGAIRRKISSIESDIATLKTNLGFFAESKKANQLKDSFQQKIDESYEELESLKQQLRLIREM